MRFDSLAGWLDWQAQLSPKTIDLGLERVGMVWKRLGSPPLGDVAISVAGTNGKGSSVAFCESILANAGYRCGSYTSPHLVSYNERIKVDGRPVDDTTLCAAFDEIESARGQVPLTYFEFGTLAALLVFSRAALDAVVLEVGLGGRLDAVNLIDSDVALICSIGLDHQDWLGNDRESIGREKAGIMRHDRPAVFSGSEMPESIRQTADAVGSRLLVAGEHFRVQKVAEHWDLRVGDHSRRALPMPGMRGAYQLANAAGAIVALDCLADRLPVDQSAIRAGLLAARVPGRFDVRPGKPTWVLDVAHNADAARVLDGLLADMFVPGERIAVCGMLRDKDIAAVAAALKGRFDRWLTVDLSDQPRGESAAALANGLRAALPVEDISAGGWPVDVFEAVASSCSDDDLVVVFGSFLTVGAAMSWLDGDGHRLSRV